MRNHSERAKVRKENRDRLSPDEQQTLELIADGKQNTEIAEIMNVSPHTVRSRVVRLMELLGAVNRAQLVKHAYEQHHVGPPDPDELQREISKLKASLEGVRSKNRELFQKAAALGGKVEVMAAEIQRLRAQNQALGNQSTAWLDTTQGRL